MTFHHACVIFELSNKPKIDLATYEELANEQTDKDNIIALRIKVLDENGGNRDVVTVDAETGEEVITPISTIGQERMEELLSDVVTRASGSMAVNASICHGDSENLPNN